MTTEEARKLFVAGLPDTITEDVLRQLFEATGGTVVEVSLPRDRATGRPRGFGFVTLSTSEEAQTARDSLDGSTQAGKTISVRPFQAEPPKRGPGQEGGSPQGNERRRPEGGHSGHSGGHAGGHSGAGHRDAPREQHQRGGNTQDRTIYVGNLPYDATQEEVEALFVGLAPGSVARITLPTDESGRKRGFGFVTLASAEAANAAIELLRGATVRARELVVNLAHPKGEKPAGGEHGHGGPAVASRPPRTFDPPPPPNDRGGGGGSGRKDKRRTEGSGGGGRRSKTWDRERGGRGDDWDKGYEDWDDEDVGGRKRGGGQASED